MVIYNNSKTEKVNHIQMAKRLLYNELCIEEYEAKTNHTEWNVWLTWGKFMMH